MGDSNLDQLLRDLADALAEDERVLTAGERALLAKVAEHVQAGATSEVEQTAADHLARAVGAAVMDRVLGVVGVVITQRLLRPETMPVAGGPGANVEPRVPGDVAQSFTPTDAA
jgi:hypothetical protein